MAVLQTLMLREWGNRSGYSGCQSDRVLTKFTVCGRIGACEGECALSPELSSETGLGVSVGLFLGVSLVRPVVGFGLTVISLGPGILDGFGLEFGLRRMRRRQRHLIVSDDSWSKAWSHWSRSWSHTRIRSKSWNNAWALSDSWDYSASYSWD